MIHFHSEDLVFKLKNKIRLKKWIVATIEKKKKKVGDISYVFCSDSFLLKMNKEYLNHDTYTDIITFDYSKDDAKQPIAGDVFISVERVKENAEKFSGNKTQNKQKKNTDFEEELHRVIIHGTLHLLGYKDKTKIAKAEMTKQEDLCLSQLKKIN
jgi:probable rRNA maturation factor